jgi:RHS repeat-associated protein
LLKSQAVYDGLGRTTERRQYEDATSYIAVLQAYNKLGRPNETSNPFRSGETIRWTTTSFDDLGRVISVTTPDSAVVNTYYNGTQVLVKDQAGKERMSLTNGLGELTDVWEITAADDATESITFPNHSEVAAGYRTKYEYDTLGNLITVTQRKGTSGAIQTRTFAYDSLKRLTSAANPESGTISYQYDNNGNLTQKTDARGIVSTYLYDALNRNYSIAYSNDPANTPSVTRTYDNPASGAYGIGRLWKTQTSGNAGTLTTIDSFDAMGRPLTQRQQFYSGTSFGQSFSVSSTYDLAGHPLTLTYPFANHTVNYNYDQAGRLGDKDAQHLAFTGNLGDGTTTRTYSSGIIYSSLGGMAKEQLGTDTPLYNKLAYNSRGQLSEMRVSTNWNNSSWDRGKIINDYSDQCSGAACDGTDNNGNLKKQTVSIPNNEPWNQQYGYDSLNRLASVGEYTGGTQPAWQQSYSYDRWGNRLIKNDASATWGQGINNVVATIDPSSNQMYASGDISLPMNQRQVQYDPAGNQTKDYLTSNGTRTYDAENRMIMAIDSSNQTSTYTYDGDGRRVKRIVNGTETWQVYGLGGELLAEYAANAAASSPQREYGYRNRQLLVTADAPPPAPNGYTYQRSVTIDHTKVPNTDQTNFPVLISGTYSYLATVANGGNVQNANGYDVIFTSDSGCATKLNHEVETYSATTGAVNYWVKVPAVSHTSDTVIYMCYGNSSITTDQSNQTAVWDANYKGVWHLPNGTSFNANDSTSNGVNGTITSTAAATGQIDGSGSFDGSSSKIDMGNASALDGMTALTISVWIKPNSLTGANRILTKWMGSFLVGTKSGAGDVLRLAVQKSGGGLSIFDSPASTLSTGSWQHFVLTWSQPNTATIYVNGVAKSVTIAQDQNVTSTGPSSTAVQIGYSADGVGNHFDGLIDEVRMSNVVRTADWSQTEYDNQNSPSTFYTVSSATGGVTPGQLHWLVTDQLGTPRMIFDQTGSLANVSRHDYLPFGEEVPANFRTGIPGYSASDNVRQKFTQKERDNETGLDYFLARYYSSTQGRFTSADPIFISDKQTYHPQLWNLYNYVGNNPLNATDPTGMELVQLGQHTDEEIDKRRKAIDAEKKAIRKDSSLSKAEQDAKRGKLEAEKQTLGLEKEGNKVVGQELASLQSHGELNGLKLTDFTLSTDSKHDFDADPRVSDDPGAGAAMFTLGGYSTQIYVKQDSNQYRSALSGDADYITFGGTSARHEQVHRDGDAKGDKSEHAAYGEQLRILQKYGPTAFKSKDFYDNAIDFVTKGSKRKD